MIEEEKVKHIAVLAKLNISDEEMPKYQKQLYDILECIEQIKKVEINEDIMISPCKAINNFKEDTIENHISTSLALKNAKETKQNYITVPKVIE